MFSTKSSSVPSVPLFDAAPSVTTPAKPQDPSPSGLCTHRIQHTGFQLCISRALASTSCSTPPSRPSLIQRARLMGQAGLQSCEHYRKRSEVDSLPDDGGFAAAEEFFADAFALWVGDNLSEARYFTAGWLHDGLEAHDLRDTVAHFDRLSPPATRLASEALARAWNVGRDRQAFSYVLCSFAAGVPESHLQPALAGVARALADVPDLGKHEACLAQFASRMVMRTPQGKAAWGAAGDTLFARERLAQPCTADHAGKRKRDPERESKQASDEWTAGGALPRGSAWTSDWTSDSTSDSQEDSPPARRQSPGPQASDADLQSFIFSVMQPASPIAQPDSVQASEGGDDAFSSPARKQGRVTPRDRPPTA